MVGSIKLIAARAGAVCYADPFVATTDDGTEEGVMSRAMGWLAVPSGWQMSSLVLDRFRDRSDQQAQSYEMAEARVRSHFRS